VPRYCPTPSQAHVREGHVNVYVYHGSSRIQRPDFLKEQDIVITTYQTLAHSLDKETETLRVFGEINWRR